MKIDQSKIIYYDNLEVDVFWTFIGTKKRFGLFCTYHRKNGEIVSYDWGKLKSCEID